MGVARGLWRRLSEVFPAKRLSAHSMLPAVRGRAPGPRGEPAGLSAEAGSAEPAEASPAGGEAYPVPCPAEAQDGPVAGSGTAMGPLVVHVDGLRIQTVTAAQFYLIRKHGGRCSIKMVPGSWLVRRYSKVLAAYTVRPGAGVDLVVSRVWGPAGGDDQAAAGSAEAAQRPGGSAASLLIHRAICLQDEGMGYRPMWGAKIGGRADWNSSISNATRYTLINNGIA